jgi:ABC-type phosphate transport system substrate-binding protein
LALNTNATYSYWDGLAASSSDITVVVRADATPTTRAFTRALANASTAFADVVGVSDLPTWPASFVQATGASGVLTAVLNTPGAIGFLDLPSWTSTSGVPYASIRNLVRTLRGHVVEALFLLSSVNRTSRTCFRRSLMFSA